MGPDEEAWAGVVLGGCCECAGRFEGTNSTGMLRDVSFLYRICYTDTSSPQEDQYPPNIAVKVNHSYCSVPVSQLSQEV